MPQTVADLRIDAGLIVPVNPRRTLLEGYSLLVGNGRILDLLPTSDAQQRYAAETIVDRPTHVLLPGLINSNAQAAATLIRSDNPQPPVDGSAASEQLVRDGVRYAAARLLKSGTTCIADRYFFPDVLARTAQEQGLRTHIGLPVADVASAWADGFGEYLSRALALRDEFRGHPLISTCFAPLDLPDEKFLKLLTIADELDAALVMDVHRSDAQIERSMALHGERPLERLARLGVLTPSFTALHMNRITPAELEQAKSSGVALTLCLHEGLAANAELPPLAAIAAAGLRFSLGSGASLLAQDVWSEMRLAALVLGDSQRALCAATGDAASLLGLDSEIGTLEAGKWADLCCLDTAALPVLPAPRLLDALIRGGARELVSDVWVGGRQLLSEGVLTRLDWPRLSPTETWSGPHAGIT